MKKFLKAAAFVTGMVTAGAAMAAPALVTTDLNLRAGPSTGYQSVGVLPNGAIVDVRGCTTGYTWCRVNYQGYDGWASSRYLAQQSGGYAGRSYSTSAAAIGIPLIAGVVIGAALNDRDNDRYYDRRDFRRDVRRDWREDRREWRRDARRDWRDDRRDWRDDRRADRRDWRDDRRGADADELLLLRRQWQQERPTND
jgi:uncharacterized protein YraI